jgi:hypothetical protein
MRGAISLVLLVAYVLGGAILSLRATRYVRDPGRRVWGLDIFRPHLFADEGQSSRRLAVRFYVLGGLVLVGLLVLVQR